MNKNFFGIVFGIAGYLIFVLVDTIIKKFLVNGYPVLQINFYITLFAIIPVLFALHFISGWRVLLNNKIHIQVLRGVSGLICAAIIINSFKKHAFSEIYPILFSAPLILTIFSYFILKEKVGPRRLAAVLIGFAGVLIVSRPGTIHFSFSLFLLFIGAILLAVNVLLIRLYANTQSAIAFGFYGCLAGLIVSGFLSYNSYIPLKDLDIFIFLIVGVIAGSGALCISAASKILESSIFAPLQYFQLIAGFIFGYLFFNDLPDFFEIIGSIVIISSGLFIIYREYKVGLRPFVSTDSRSRDFVNRGH